MVTELDAQIGRRLQVARKALGFKSARSFARHHNIPESTYSQHETGKRSLSPSILLTYCDQLKVTPGWIVSGTQKVKDNEDILNLPLLRSILKKELFGLLQPNAQHHFNKLIDFCVEAYTHAVKKQEQGQEQMKAKAVEHAG